MQNAECRIKRPDGERQTTGDGLSAFENRKSKIENRRRPFCILHSAFCISSRGQAMAEYVIIAGLLMACLGILTVFFVTFKEYGGRISALLSSEYP